MPCRFLLACFQQIPIENVKNSPVRCFFRKTKKLTEVNFLFVNDNYLSQLIFQGSIQKQRSIFRQIRIPMVGSLEFQHP